MTPEGDRGATTDGMKSAGYYDAHSEYQRRVVEGGDEVIREVVAGMPLDGVDTFALADLGAGTGAASVHSVRTAVTALRERASELPVLAIHNDVITNDFTALFGAVAGEGGYLGLDGGPVYPAAAAGSFYSQVVPTASLNLVTCSNAHHWYRTQPAARTPDTMWFSETADDARGALADQAASEWLAFLTARAAELAPEGRLFVEGIGRTEGPDGTEHVSASRLLRVMWEVAAGLADDGLLDRSVLDAYVFPVYCRSVEETTEPVSAGGALASRFEVGSASVDEVPNPYWEMLERDGDREAYASAYTAFVRAFSESTLTDRLFEPGARGIEPSRLCDEFFTRFEATSATDPDAGRYEAWILRAVFVRSGDRGA